MNRIILPLDNQGLTESLMIAEKSAGLVWGYKLRRQIVMHGVDIIKKFKEFGNVMVDFKFYDIPSAMDEAVSLMLAHDADIVTVHCSADWPTYRDHVAGVTILTSKDMRSFGKHYKNNIKDMVVQMAHESEDHGYDYIVCSPEEVGLLSAVKCKKICPGIRPLWYLKDDDQNRTATPREAIDNGADLLVIGRPILKAPNLLEALRLTNAEIG